MTFAVNWITCRGDLVVESVSGQIVYCGISSQKLQSNYVKLCGQNYLWVIETIGEEYLGMSVESVFGGYPEELYSNAYVYVLPSDLEDMLLCLLEAMSYNISKSRSSLRKKVIKVYDLDTIGEVFRHFFPDENVLRLEKERGGTINDTYKVYTTIGDYIIQEISCSVFGGKTDALEYNYKLFLNEYEKYGEERVGFAIPLWISDRHKKLIFTDIQGRHWRIYKYLQGKSFDLVSVPNRIEQFGISVASMHFLLSGISIASKKVINYYHDIRYYISDFLLISAINERDSTCEEIISTNIQFILENCIFEKNCIIHGDTKIGNILYDFDTARVSFIDLDTFFYSSKLIDIGDSIRSISNKGGDIPEQIDKVYFDSLSCINFLKAYLSSPVCNLNDEEIVSLPYAIMRIPFELGLRFYTDYLRGNQYFTADYKDQNLQRAKCQFKLYQDIKNNGIVTLINDL